MRIICNEYGIDCIFKENIIIEWLIDSTELFLELTTKIWRQYYDKEEFLIISECDKELKMDKDVEIIGEPFCIEMNNRKILNKLYQEMSQTMYLMQTEQIHNTITSLEQMIITACEQSDYSLIYDADFAISDLLKLFNVRFDFQNEGMIERLISYVKLVHRVLGISLFVFINVKSYISENLLEKFYQNVLYEKVFVLMLERHEIKKNRFEKRIIIDKNACVIYDE